MWCFWRPNVPDRVLPWFEQDFGIWALIHKRWISVMSVQEIHRKSEEITYDHFSAALMGKSSRHHWGLHAWFAHPLHTVYNLRSQEHGSWEKLSSLLHMLTGLSNRCWHRAASLPCFQAWKHWCNDTVPVARCMPKTSMGLQQWHPQVYAHPLENTELEGGHTFQAQLDFIDIGYKPLQRISRNFVADLQMWILNVFVNDDIAAICNLCGVCPILEDLSQIFICQRCLARILHQPHRDGRSWILAIPRHAHLVNLCHLPVHQHGNSMFLGQTLPQLDVLCHHLGSEIRVVAAIHHPRELRLPAKRITWGDTHCVEEPEYKAASHMGECRGDIHS